MKGAGIRYLVDMRKYLLAACLVSGVAVIGIGVRASRRRPSVPPIRLVTDARLLAADSSGEWLTYGRDYANRRFVPFTQINRRTVHRWRRDGLSERQADRLATSIGYHPAEVWPQIADAWGIALTHHRLSCAWCCRAADGSALESGELSIQVTVVVRFVRAPRWAGALRPVGRRRGVELFQSARELLM